MLQSLMGFMPLLSVDGISKDLKQVRTREALRQAYSFGSSMVRTAP